MPAQRHRIAELIVKYLNDELSAAEKIELDAFIDSSPQNKQLFEALTNVDTLASTLRLLPGVDAAEQWEKIQQRTAREKRSSRLAVLVDIPWKQVVAVAAVLLVTFFVTHLFIQRQNMGPGPMDLVSYLMLPDGHKLSLDALPNGLHEFRGARLLKEDSVISLRYSHAAYRDTGQLIWHVVKKQYTIALPDSSRVKLYENASLQYAAAYDERAPAVTLSGDGDFCVNKQASRPFRANYAIDALDREPVILGTAIAYGTQFRMRRQSNRHIISLQEGHLTVTTLTDSFPLLPNEWVVFPTSGQPYTQSLASKTDEKALPAAPFAYNNVPIQTVVADLQKHYAIKVFYAGQLPKKKLTLRFDRSTPLANVIKVIQGLQYPIRLEGDSLIVGK